MSKTTDAPNPTMKMKPTPGPITVHYDEKWPFRICIKDANGKDEFSFDRYAMSSQWKTVSDMRRAVGWDAKDREQIIEMTAEQEARAEFIAEAFNVHHETGLSPRELLEQRDNLLEWLDTLTLVVGLTPIAGNKEALQEAMNGARAAIAATKPEAVKGGEG